MKILVMGLLLVVGNWFRKLQAVFNFCQLLSKNFLILCFLISYLTNVDYEVVKWLIEHEGNLASTTCTKPDNKRQRSEAGCCGRGQFFTFCSGGGAINCCGATHASDGWCYADHGSYPTIAVIKNFRFSRNFQKV